jgi:ribose transport system substrate-binding protein
MRRGDEWPQHSVDAQGEPKQPPPATTAGNVQRATGRGVRSGATSFGLPLRQWAQACREAFTRRPLLLPPATPYAARRNRFGAAFSNIGLQVTWCTQGKQAAEFWGKLFNVDVTWFDGGLSAIQQRAALEEIASRDWDFVAIQAVEIDTLGAPVNRLIEAGIPVIDMDTLIAPLDQIAVHTFLAPDNEFMGAVVTEALVDAIGGTGTVIMTQGALGHTGAQGRARGFESVIARHPNIEVLSTEPADWDPAKAAQLWESYLSTYSHISAAFFHNDDMALAALEVMKARNRTDIRVGGVDAMPPAIHAVLDGRMHATVRNSSCRIHGGAIVAGVEAALAPKKTPAAPPKHIIIDGPIVTQANAPGLLWMEDHFLI